MTRRRLVCLYVTFGLPTARGTRGHFMGCVCSCRYPVTLSHHIPTPAVRYTLRVVRGYVVPEVGRRPTTRTPSEGLHSVRAYLEVLREIILLEIRPMHRAGQQ